MIDLSKLLQVMVEHDASDIYLTVDSAPMYRINGTIRPAGNRALTAEDTEALANSVMSERQSREFMADNEQNLALNYPNLGRFRVNIFRQKDVVGLVVRHIKSRILSIDELGLPQGLREIAMSPRGLVLVVGAAGSGKSSTLAALIDHRNSTTAGHIICIEDPIEFVHAHKKSIVTQREIGMDTHDYHHAIKNALRQSPDVVMIGEIRDPETMEAALAFAETGHLCFATLHSTSSTQAMERILSFFPPERQQQIYLELSLNMRAIVSQRMLKATNGSRCVAVELLLDSPRIKDLIHKGQLAELKEAMEKSATIGMQTFDQALFVLYRAGRISLEEAMRNADSQNNLRLRIKLESEPAVAQETPLSEVGRKESEKPEEGMLRIDIS
ncbi:MAG: PilT/PilU family type 4a pilus ATPase [Proteobacteria bacterium]|nr:PilT/PilU family type 4a pilus ATPase [Pseudomonadota bacterium]